MRADARTNARAAHRKAVERTVFEAIVLRAGPRINFTIDKHFKYEDLLTCFPGIHASLPTRDSDSNNGCLRDEPVTLFRIIAMHL